MHYEINTWRGNTIPTEKVWFDEDQGYWKYLGRDGIVQNRRPHTIDSIDFVR